MNNFDIFMCGFLFCALSDILFAIANYFVQKAFKERVQRKQIEKENEK